jgi:hypothetical protein
MIGRVNYLNLQLDLLSHLLTVVDSFNVPLFLSHLTPPVYATIVEAIKDACQ